eukprot:gene9312-1400_t
MPLLQFSSVFTNKEVGDEFYKFLKEDQSEESWEFIRLSLKYTKKHTKVSESRIDSLVNKFIKEDGSKSINIGSKDRKTLLSELGKYNVDALRPVQETLLSEIKFDSFKRFIRSKRGLNMIKKYEKDPNIVVPDLTSKVSYNNNDFIKQKVEPRDFEFMEFLFKDSNDWELFSSFREGEYGKRIGNIWYSENNFLPDVTLFKERSVSKYEIKLPFDFEHVLCSCFPLTQQMRNEEWNSNSETLTMPKGNEEPFSTFIQYLSLPFPYTPRIVPGVAAVNYKRDSCMLICKPCHIDSLQNHKWGENKELYCKIRKDGKEKKNKVYKMFDYSCTFIQRIGSQKTSFSQIHLFSIGGWVKNKSTLRTIVQDRGSHLVLGLIENLKRIKSIQTISELKTKNFFERDGLAHLLAVVEDELLEDADKTYEEKESYDFIGDIELSSYDTSSHHGSYGDDVSFMK